VRFTTTAVTPLVATLPTPVTWILRELSAPSVFPAFGYPEPVRVSVIRIGGRGTYLLAVLGAAVCAVATSCGVCAPALSTNGDMRRPPAKRRAVVMAQMARRGISFRLAPIDVFSIKREQLPQPGGHSPDG
jgi:hypothetical protein